MSEAFSFFERIARATKNVGQPAVAESHGVHPFDERNIHPDIAGVSVKLFDDGHYAQATFEAFKYIDNQVKAASGLEDTGFSLMITDLATMSDKDEQKGFRYVFAGTMSGIRNPRGHDHRVDSIDLCLDHLSVASILLRTLEARKS